MPIDVASVVPQQGVMGAWLRFASEFESPDSFFLFSLLAAAGGAVNGRIVVNPQSEPAPFTNLYVVLYGPSGSRKNTAMNRALRLLHDAVPEAPIFPRSFTMEGLVKRMARDSEVNGKASGLIVTYEMSDLLGGAEYLKPNSRFLTDIWDCPPIYPRETVQHGTQEILQPYVGLLGASSPDWLEQIDPRTLAGGFLRRLLLVSEPGPKRRNARPRADDVLFTGIARVLRERLGPDAFGATEMRLDSGAEARKAAWYDGTVKAIWGAADEKAGHFASCMEAHALKLAALIHLIEGGKPDTLTEQPLVTAQGLLEAIVRPLFRAYASLVPTAFARLRAAILRTVQVNGGTVPEMTLDRMVLSSTGQRPKEIWLAKESLIREGALVRTGTLIQGV